MSEKLQIVISSGRLEIPRISFNLCSVHHVLPLPIAATSDLNGKERKGTQFPHL
jgi:hypothetical protein